VISQLVRLSNAYDSDNVLVDYGDLIKMSKDKDYADVDLEMKLYSFPYIDQVSFRAESYTTSAR